MTGAASGSDPTGSVAFYECGPTANASPCTSGSWTPVRHRVPERECQPLQCHLEGVYPDIHRLLVLRRRLFG